MKWVNESRYENELLLWREDEKIRVHLDLAPTDLYPRKDYIMFGIWLYKVDTEFRKKFIDILRSDIELDKYGNDRTLLLAVKGQMESRFCIAKYHKNTWNFIDKFLSLIESVDQKGSESLNMVRQFIKEKLPIYQPSSLISQALFKVNNEINKGNVGVKNKVQHLPQDLKDKLIMETSKKGP